MARTFGVEIECVMETPKWTELNAKLPGWDISTDGSVYCGAYEGETCGGEHDCGCEWCGYDPWDNECTVHIGAEIKTPILEGIAGFRELKKGFRVLKAQGAEVNRTCGMHVHHGGSDLTVPQIVRLLKVWDANRNTIEQLVDDERIDGEYSYTFSSYALEQLDAVENEPAEQALTTICRWFSHGCEVNVSALNAHGTIEFRLHHGTMDYDEAEAWVRFGQGLIADVVGKNKVGEHEVPVAEFLDHTCSTKKSKEILAAKIERRSARLAAPRR